MPSAVIREFARRAWAGLDWCSLGRLCLLHVGENSCGSSFTLNSRCHEVNYKIWRTDCLFLKRDRLLASTNHTPVKWLINFLILTAMSANDFIRALKAPSDPPHPNGPSKIQIARQAWDNNNLYVPGKAEIIVDWILTRFLKDRTKDRWVQISYFLFLSSCIIIYLTPHHLTWIEVLIPSSTRVIGSFCWMPYQPQTSLKVGRTFVQLMRGWSRFSAEYLSLQSLYRYSVHALQIRMKTNLMSYKTLLLDVSLDYGRLPLRKFLRRLCHQSGS